MPSAKSFYLVWTGALNLGVTLTFVPQAPQPTTRR